MSGHTTRLTGSRRLTQLRSRTTPGSYEAPVEGIVDYGAFSEGFEKGIAPGLSYLAEIAKEEEMPDLITLEDFDYTGTASKSGALGVSTEASNSMNLGIDNKIRDIQARLDSAVVRKDINLQRQIMNEYNTLKKVVAGTQVAFNSIAGGEGVIDARQAIDKKIGRNADGKGLSWYEISTIGNQKDSTFEFVTNADGTGGLRVNGYYFDTTSINENTVSKITPLTGGLSAAIKDYSSRVKAPEVTKNQVEYDQNGKRITSQRISQNSYDNMEEAAGNFAKEEILNNKATFQANYLDALYGVNKSISDNPSEFFKGIAIEDNVGNNKKYKTEQDYIAAIDKGEDTYTFKGISFTDFASGNGSEQNVQDLLEKYGSNYYKLTEGSKAYAANDYGVAVKKDNLFTSKEIEPKSVEGGFGFGRTPGLNDASRILAQINFNQSGAPGASLDYFKDIRVQGGVITNPRITTEGKNKFLEYDVDTGTSVITSKAGAPKRFNLNDAEDRANLARRKALTLGGSDEDTDNIINSFPQAIKLRTDTQDVFGFYSTENRQTGITGSSVYANAINHPNWKKWWSRNKQNYIPLKINDAMLGEQSIVPEEQQINRANKILQDFSKFLSLNPN